jgi:hypothetical protein
MNSTVETLSAANESTLKYVTSVQESVLSAYRDMASSVKADVPTPVAPWLPAPEPQATREVVEETFAFATKLLEANKAFVFGLLEASEPVAKAAAKK